MWLAYFLWIVLASASEQYFSKDLLRNTPVMKPSDIVNFTSDESETYEPTVQWNTFIAVLIKVTTEQIERVKRNVKQYYGLTGTEMTEVDVAFNQSNVAYEAILQKHIKKLAEKKKFNSTPEFMIEFTDLSNYVLGQIVKANLAKIKGKFLLPTKWYKLLMREKIWRQQYKVATNYINVHICTTMLLCAEIWNYSEYLVEWLRHFMNLSAYNLEILFKIIPDVLEKHKFCIKSNNKFKRTVKYIVNSNDVVHRDTIDYLDEVLSDKKNVLNLVPDSLKKGAILLIEMFKIIDNSYELNVHNEAELEKISKMIYKWIDGFDVNINVILESILENLAMNIKIWPLNIQSRLDYTWSQILLL